MKFRILLLILSAATMGCFSEQSAVNSSSSTAPEQSAISPSDFSGATSAKNKITGIEIKWNASLVEPTAYRVYRVTGSKLSLLTSLGSSITSFVDGTVSYGTIYSYVVKAVDANGIEDSNSSKVSAIAWAGISTVTALSRTSLQLTFDNAVAAASEVRIYLQPASGGDKVLAKTVSGSTTTVVLSGLKTAYKYKISAQAFVSTLNKEDGNTAVFTVATDTLGYDGEGSSTAKWMNVSNVRAFGASPGAAMHPLYPERTPTDTYLGSSIQGLVELAFIAFNGMSSSTQYVVTRSTVGYDLDTSVEAACETSTLSSCRVKCSSSSSILTGSGVLICRDLKAGASPKRYRYTMSVLHTSGAETWAEPLSADDLDAFSVLVPIPPPNMILVQRDAVNYEMCGQMNSTPDPLNHNRCPYLGIGATPYNSGPGKPELTFDAGYYDFGYNLFEDRFQQGCSWSSAANGGKCGAGNTTGDCIGTGTTAPASTIGISGNVYLLIYPQTAGASSYPANTCYYNYNGTWYRANQVVNSVPDPTEAFTAMFTADPRTGSGKIPMSYDSALTQAATWRICEAQTDPDYGTKRLPRVREFRAFSAFATHSNDTYLYGITPAQANTLTNGGGYNSTTGYRCATNVSFANYVDTGGTSLYPTSVAQALTSEAAGMYSGGMVYGRNSFWLGATATVDCQSRYGAQDVVTNANTWTSDNFLVNPTTKIITGTVSAFDSGNRDLLQDLNGGLTGVQISYSTATTDGNNWYYLNYPSSSSTTAVNYISLPLGIPIMSSSSSVYLPRLLFTENYNPSWYFINASSASITPLTMLTSRRWSTNTVSQGVTSSQWSAVRCVMSAD